MANQIILQAFASNEEIRIICVPNLAALIQSIVNFSCYAFVIDNWSECAELDKWSAKLICKYFPVPTTIQSYFKQRRENSNCQMEVDEPVSKMQRSPNVTIEVSRFYLTKDPSKQNQRAFIPKNAINLKPIALELESLNKIKSDYISLDTYDGNSNQPSLSKHAKKHKKRPLTLYRELTINKVQSNPKKAKKFKNKMKKT